MGVWVGIPGLILGQIGPCLLRYPHETWMALGHALEFSNGYIILGFVFVLVVTPTGCLMRLAGYDPLRKQKKGARAYIESFKNDTLAEHEFFDQWKLLLILLMKWWTISRSAKTISWCLYLQLLL